MLKIHHLSQQIIVNFFISAVPIAHLFNRLAAVDLSGENELLEKTDAASLQVEYLRKAVAIGLFYEARCFERGLGVQCDQQRSAELFSKVWYSICRYQLSCGEYGDITRYTRTVVQYL